MKKLLLLLIIPFLSFGQIKDLSKADAVWYSKNKFIKDLNLTFKFKVDVTILPEWTYMGENNRWNDPTFKLYSGWHIEAVRTSSLNTEMKRTDGYRTLEFYFNKYYNRHGFPASDPTISDSYVGCLMYWIMRGEQFVPVIKEDLRFKVSRSRRHLKYYNDGALEKSIKVYDSGHKEVKEYKIYQKPEKNKKSISRVKNRSFYSPNNRLVYYEEYHVYDTHFVDSVINENSYQHIISKKLKIGQPKKIKLFHDNGELFLHIEIKTKNSFYFDRHQNSLDPEFEITQIVAFDESQSEDPIFVRTKNGDGHEGVWRYTYLFDGSIDSTECFYHGVELRELIDIDVYTLTEFYQKFKQDCDWHNIVGLPDDKNVKIIERPLDKNTLAEAYGKNQDEIVFIAVDPTEWKNASIVKKWYIMYHELGHDVFNLDHGEGGRMCASYASKDYTWFEFLIDRKRMFDLVKKRIKARVVSGWYGEQWFSKETNKIYNVASHKKDMFLEAHPEAEFQREQYHLYKK